MERTLEKGALIRSRNIAVKRGAITGKRTADFFAAKSKTLNFEIKFQVSGYFLLLLLMLVEKTFIKTIPPNFGQEQQLSIYLDVFINRTGKMLVQCDLILELKIALKFKLVAQKVTTRGVICFTKEPKSHQIFGLLLWENFSKKIFSNQVTLSGCPKKSNLGSP